MPSLVVSDLSNLCQSFAVGSEIARDRSLGRLFHVTDECNRLLFHSSLLPEAEEL